VRYEVGDVLRYYRASKETGIEKGQYAKVRSIDSAANRLTVELHDGTERTYDPRWQRSVSVFREEIRRFSVGDRIQFTAPASELKIANPVFLPVRNYFAEHYVGGVTIDIPPDGRRNKK
jgi:hypothetical protein